MFNRIPREILIFGLLFCIFLLTASGNIDSIDANTNIFLAKKITFENKIYFEKDENKLGMPVYYDKVQERYYSVYNPGFALIQIPGQLLDKVIRNSINVQIPDYPFEPNIILTLWSNLLNAIIVPLIAVFIYKIYFLISKKKKLDIFRIIFIIGLVLSSNLFVQAHLNFAHPLFTLFFLISFYYLHLYTLNNRYNNLVYFSIFFALTAISYNATFVLLIPGLLIYTFQRNRRILQVVLAIIPAILTQLIWNYLRFNNVFKTGYVELGFAIFDFNIQSIIQKIYGLTFAPSKGFFIYSPIITLLIIVVFKWKQSKFKDFILLFWIIYFAYLTNYAISTIWHGEATYGPRYMTVLIPFGIVALLLHLDQIKKQLGKKIILLAMFLGFFVQIPGILIPPFALPFLSPSKCSNFNQNYFYDWSCSPVKVGWSHIIKRRTNETFTAISGDYKKGELIDSYPNPIRPFRTTYNDPIFNVFSNYKTTNNTPIIGDIYSFIFDIWWIKGILYKNIFNI